MGRGKIIDIEILDTEFSLDCILPVSCRFTCIGD